MEATAAPLPEFDRMREHAIPPPTRGAGDFAVGIALLDFPEPPFELLAARNDDALRRGPRPEFGAIRPAPKVDVRLLGRDLLNAPLDPHLALELVPIEDKRRTRVGIELASLAA